MVLLWVHCSGCPCWSGDWARWTQRTIPTSAILWFCVITPHKSQHGPELSEFYVLRIMHWLLFAYWHQWDFESCLLSSEEKKLLVVLYLHLYLYWVAGFFWYIRGVGMENLGHFLDEQHIMKGVLFNNNNKTFLEKKGKKIAIGAAWMYIYVAKSNVNFCLRWFVKEKWVAVGHVLLVKRMSTSLMNTRARPASSAPGPMMSLQVNKLLVCLCYQLICSSAKLKKPMADTSEYEDSLF